MSNPADRSGSVSTLGSTSGSRPARRTEIIAHRGDSAHAPENTLRAFERAIEQGADRIELDLQRSADGEVFVFHDATLERLTATEGVARDQEIERLRELNVLADLHAPAPDTCIPTLDEVLHAVGERIPLYLEIKAEDGGPAGALEALVDACLERVDPEGLHVVASFHLGVVRRCADAGHRPVLITVEPRRVDELGAHYRQHLAALSVRHDRVGATLVHRCHEHGLPLWTWTVDDPAEADRLLDLGPVAGVCTNDPGSLRRWRDGRSARA